MIGKPNKIAVLSVAIMQPQVFVIFRIKTMLLFKVQI